jgi:hypothetical protein
MHQADSGQVRPVTDEEIGLRVLREPQTPLEDPTSTVEYTQYHPLFTQKRADIAQHRRDPRYRRPS